MKKTKISTDDTSYYGSSVTATLAQMRKALGAPDWEDNKGLGKVNFEWERETETGLVFTVYDWKYYREIDDNEDIQWNIGGHSKDATEAARGEIEKALQQIGNKEECTCFLFGLDAIVAYNDGGADAAAEAIAEGKGDVFRYTNEHRLYDLLTFASGWGDFTEISEDEYNLITKEA